MKFKIPAASLILAAYATASQPLPDLRTEPIPAGSVFFVKNGATQPVTAFLIELVNYPGSSYSLWRDEAATDLIAPGGEIRIQVTNMTVGAVPNYVKLQAALFSDGSSAGIPEKIAQMIERRRFCLVTMRDLISRLAKASADSTSPPGLAGDLKQCIHSLQPLGKARLSQTSLNQSAARGILLDAVEYLDSHSVDETLAEFRAAERSLAASKPSLTDSK